MKRPRLRGGSALAAATALLLLLTACTGSPAAPEGEPDGPAYPSYVALGDSFTAGPMVPEPVFADGCNRSTGNYPSLLAERLEVEDFTDVSCGGARTTDLSGRQDTGAAKVPPQLNALDEDTDLVTLGIGGNDFGLFISLVGTCVFLGGPQATGSPCADTLGEQQVLEQVAGIGDRVQGSLRLVQERAPEATVVLVGYPQIVPPRGRCGEIPFAAGDYAFARRVTTALDRALEKAAGEAGVRYADWREASAGHDICADEPWVNGRETDEERAQAFHPFPEGMEGAADAVEAALPATR